MSVGHAGFDARFTQEFHGRAIDDALLARLAPFSAADDDPQFVVGQFVNAVRVGVRAGVSGVDAVDVGGDDHAGCADGVGQFCGHLIGAVSGVGAAHDDDAVVFAKGCRVGGGEGNVRGASCTDALEVGGHHLGIDAGGLDADAVEGGLVGVTRESVPGQFDRLARGGASANHNEEGSVLGPRGEALGDHLQVVRVWLCGGKDAASEGDDGRLSHDFGDSGLWLEGFAMGTWPMELGPVLHIHLPRAAVSVGAEDWSERQKYTFKRTIEELAKYRGMGTELVTLYIPPSRQISDAAGMLRDEIGQASNIKSKQTATAVQSALTSMLARLKPYKQTPETGLALFVGTVSAGGNKTKQVAHVIEPPAPVATYQYRCDSTFNIDPLKGMMDSEDVYGLLIVDRQECSIGILRGKHLQSMHNKQSMVPRKHGKGGQSQRRFERLTEEAANHWFVEVGDRASEIFMNEPRLKAVIVGGPGPTKDFFHSEGYLHHEIEKKVHAQTFDTGYTDDDQGLKELVMAASEAISGIGMMEDKKLMQRFLKETAKPDGGLAEYGEETVRQGLELGAVDHLLISEDMRRTRLKFTERKTGEVVYKTVQDHKVQLAFDEMAKQWGGANNVEMEEKDLIEELSDIAEANGTNIHIIGGASEEGGILRNAFGGIVGILRFRFR